MTPQERRNVIAGLLHAHEELLTDKLVLISLLESLHFPWEEHYTKARKSPKYAKVARVNLSELSQQVQRVLDDLERS